MEETSCEEFMKYHKNKTGLFYRFIWILLLFQFRKENLRQNVNWNGG